MADQVQGAIGNIEEIVRSEIRLAQAEMRQKVSAAGKAGVSVAAGGVGFLLVAVHKGLSRLTRPGFSAFAIGAALGGASAAMIGSGMKKVRSLNLTPQQTIQTAKETVAAVKGLKAES